MSDESRQERAARANEHRAAHERRRAQEAAKAQILVDRFVADAVYAGLPVEELTARPWHGRGRYRTGVVGWYLRSDGSVGVSRDGGFYLLTVPPVRFGRWRTVRVDPVPPPLQVGEGARDGESVALELLLRMRLGGA
ncbi:MULTISPECIES: hypothetical protein [unclassified Nocardioides]|uniref:hypothetical protein n=1 Tax=Nocardioides sp. URHA0032 TaxID=1380388 RepID=UPI00048FED33|nr:hypothetical protein [Nocardioides sp. URHA0032]